jgi:Fibronectin type III domain
MAQDVGIANSEDLHCISLMIKNLNDLYKIECWKSLRLQTLTLLRQVTTCYLTATAVSSSEIDLSWTDNSDNETEFKVERSTDAGITFIQIATVDADVTTYPDTGLAPSTTYSYRVRASNSTGDSDYSNTAIVITSP